MITLRRLLVWVTLVGIAFGASLAFAQNAADPPAVQQSPAGLGTAVLLLGILAIVIVGGLSYLRERRERDNDPHL